MALAVKNFEWDMEISTVTSAIDDITWIFGEACRRVYAKIGELWIEFR